MLNSMRSNPTLRGLFSVYAGTFLSGAWAMIIPTIPVLSRQFGVSAGAAAQIVTAFVAGKFIGTIVSGVVLDRMGTRAALISGPLTGSIAAILAGWSPWLSAILGFAVVMGAGDSLWSSGREVAGIDLARRSQRGRVLSSMHGTYNIGLAVCPLLGGWLTDRFSFRAAFVAYAVAASASVFLAFMMPEMPVRPAARTVPRFAGASGARSLKGRLRALIDLFNEMQPDLRPTYLVLVLATLASQSQRILVQSMLPLYAATYLHLSPTQIGMLFSISGVIVFSMIIPAGFVMDRVGRKWCTVPSTGVPALAFLLIPLTDSFYQLAIIVSFTGLANGLSLGSIATSTYDVVPAHVRGRLQALRRTIAELGSGLAPIVGGYLATEFNPGLPFLVYAPLLVISAALLALIGRETLRR